MAVPTGANPISRMCRPCKAFIEVLNKSEIIKRTLDYLQVALGFYVKEVMMRTMTPEEAQSALEVRKDRDPDVPALLKYVTKHSAFFPELNPFVEDLHLIRKIRNKWAHAEPVDDLNILTFLHATETALCQIVTEANTVCLDQVRAHKQCYLLMVAEKTLQDLTQVDYVGNTMLVYPELVPAYDD